MIFFLLYSKLTKFGTAIQFVGLKETLPPLQMQKSQIGIWGEVEKYPSDKFMGIMFVQCHCKFQAIYIL